MSEATHPNAEYDYPDSKRPRLDQENGVVSWPLEDLSSYRPEAEQLGKDKSAFRVFNDKEDPRYELTRSVYSEMNSKQCVDFVKAKLAKWTKLDKAKMGMMDAVMMLDNIIDGSDPDVSEPNSYHCFQTAERIREKHPDKDWFHLTGLIHDAGKVMALWGEPQFAVVGDTFPVGCAFSTKCVFKEFFENNPDFHHETYSTKYGMYEANCGLDKVLMSFGHDEYLYQVLVGNKCTLPKEALYMIRFHSFYPWHTGKEYDHLCSQADRDILSWVSEFNCFDLYSKADVKPDIPALKEYYQKLIDKYVPGELKW